MKEYKVGERIVFKNQRGAHQYGTVLNIVYKNNDLTYLVTEDSGGSVQVESNKIMTLINE
jgi:hypothetical protein